MDHGSIRHYFVDEAGCAVLFNRSGDELAGTPGCSRYFLLGLLAVPDPDRLAEDLATLRAQLLADPYLRGIPSMQPGEHKTADAFHATDDCPEVRLEVFRLLQQHELKFFAVVRDKRVITQLVRAHNERHPGYRYRPDQLYDRCVSRLFRDRLHKDDGYTVHFARRGSRTRTAALQAALAQARANCHLRHGIDATTPVEIIPLYPKQSAGLQAVDYFLWALQRFYERRDPRYVDFLRDRISLVHDVDDTRTNLYGEYFTKKNPLLREKLRDEAGNIGRESHTA